MLQVAAVVLGILGLCHVCSIEVVSIVLIVYAFFNALLIAMMKKAME